MFLVEIPMNWSISRYYNGLTLILLMLPLLQVTLKMESIVTLESDVVIVLLLHFQVITPFSIVNTVSYVPFGKLDWALFQTIEPLL